MELQDKLSNIQGMLKGHRVLVALSGGVDSSVLTQIALDALGSNQVMAVTVNSEIIAGRELAAAIDLGKSIGINHRVINLRSLDHPVFATNPPDRCYHCKLMIYTALLDMAAENGYTMVIEGTNASDTSDYRPGMRALSELGIISPFLTSGMTKAEIRLLAKEYGLSNWDRSSNACLASRFPYGTAITSADLQRVEACENILYAHGFAACRVRHHGDIARIELPLSQIETLVLSADKAAIIGEIKAQGYKFVALDLEGYRTGSLNTF